jgi:hypothetical protein
MIDVNDRQQWAAAASTGRGCGGYPKVVVLAAATSTMLSVAGVVRLFVATKESREHAHDSLQTHGLGLHHRR